MSSNGTVEASKAENEPSSSFPASLPPTTMSLQRFVKNVSSYPFSSCYLSARDPTRERVRPSGKQEGGWTS